MKKSVGKINYIQSRHVSRIIALSSLYEANTGKKDISDGLEYLCTLKPYTNSTKSFAKELAIGVYQKIAELDEVLKSHLSMDWDYERLGLVEKNILRLAVYELICLNDIPFKTTIQEAITIADRYGSAKSAKLVHGVISGIHSSLSNQLIDKSIFDLVKQEKENIEENIEEDIEEDIEKSIEDDVVEDIVEDTEEDVKEDIEEDVEEDIVEDIVEDTEEDVKEDIEEDVEEDVEEDIVESIEENIEDKDDITETLPFSELDQFSDVESDEKENHLEENTLEWIIQKNQKA